MSKKVLTFITRRAPYGQALPKACLDMVLSAAVFDQHVNLIFMDDGVLQLQSGQAPVVINSKNLSAAFTALPLYEVHNLYADSESLTARGLNADSLVVNVEISGAQKIAELIRQSDVVFNL